MAYVELVKILDKMEQTLWNRTIHFVKVLWKHHQVADATWEPKWILRAKYPACLNPVCKILGMKFLFRGRNARATLFRPNLETSCCNYYICLVITSAFWKLVDKIFVSHVLVNCNVKTVRISQNDVTDLLGI